MVHFITNIDREILLFIQEFFRYDFLNPIMKFITTLGNGGAIWILLSLCLCINKKTRKIGIVSLCSLAFCFMINNIILKNLVLRIRPYDQFPEIIRLVQKPHDYSFPSGHTCSSFAAACIYYRYFDKKYGIAALVLAALIGFSRLYVGVHFPTDVLVGMMIGIIGSQCVYYLSRRMEKRSEVSPD